MYIYYSSYTFTYKQRQTHQLHMITCNPCDIMQMIGTCIFLRDVHMHSLHAPVGAWTICIDFSWWQTSMFSWLDALEHVFIRGFCHVCFLEAIVLGSMPCMIIDCLCAGMCMECMHHVASMHGTQTCKQHL